MRFQKGRKKTGGRKPGVKNKATMAREKALADLVVDQTDPFSFFVSIMKNPDAPFEKREAAADRLLPYTRPKLSAVEAREGTITHEQRLEALAKLLGED